MTGSGGRPAGGGPVRVYVVDDHHLFRAGLRSELAGRVAVVGEAATVDEAVEGITRTRPDVVLLDVHLPDGGGTAVLERIGDLEGVTVLALSASDASRDVVETVRAGARGYVTKTVETDELVAAIHTVAGGDAVFSPRLAGFVLDAFASMPAAAFGDEELSRLTAREREVLQLVARGYTYREIGERLVVTKKTVESHVSAVLRKLQLTNRHELARWASERNL